MTDPPQHPKPDEDTGGNAERDPAGSRSRWGLVLGITAAIALVTVMVLLHISGTIGPGMH
jgi:hypothetical protein